jgi:hypothetical protein
MATTSTRRWARICAAATALLLVVDFLIYAIGDIVNAPGTYGLTEAFVAIALVQIAFAIATISLGRRAASYAVMVGYTALLLGLISLLGGAVLLALSQPGGKYPYG